MPLDTEHPEYEAFKLDWVKLRDCYAGEERIKDRGIHYLPPTRGMILDGMGGTQYLGWQMYQAYKLRAIWHDLFKEAVEAYIGLLHYKSAQITLPDSMQGIRSNEGETMQQLLRRINEQQLVTGRLGLLADLPVNPDRANPMPYIALYNAETIRNWDVGVVGSTLAKLNYVVLDESGFTNRDTADVFTRVWETRYRVCSIGNLATNADGKYATAQYAQRTGMPVFNPLLLKSPSIRGDLLDEIPFSFINTKDILARPDKAPLLGLANAMLAIYRGEADYRQNLFMQGQDTLVVIGTRRKTDATQDEEGPIRTGAGSRIDLDTEGDAKYIGVNSAGLPEQRQALGNDRQHSEVRAGQLVNARLGDKESGEALRTRLAAQTATLKQIALAGGAGLEAQLKACAKWKGEDPNKVKVEVNEEFSADTATGQDVSQLMDGKDKGAPISYKSIHDWMVDKGYTKQNFEEEFKQISEEKAMVQVLMNPVLQGNIQKGLDNSDPANQPPPKPPAK